MRLFNDFALKIIAQEEYIQGVSTRSVDELVNLMGMTEIFKMPGLTLVC